MVSVKTDMKPHGWRNGFWGRQLEPQPTCRWYDRKAKKGLFGLYTCRWFPEDPQGDNLSQDSSTQVPESAAEAESGSDDYGASDNESQDFKSAKYIATTIGYGDSALIPHARECAVPIADPCDLDEDVEYLIDTGADFAFSISKRG